MNDPKWLAERALYIADGYSHIDKPGRFKLAQEILDFTRDVINREVITAARIVERYAARYEDKELWDISNEIRKRIIK